MKITIDLGDLTRADLLALAKVLHRAADTRQTLAQTLTTQLWSSAAQAQADRLTAAANVVAAAVQALAAGENADRSAGRE